jgi:hypothetical protein
VCDFEISKECILARSLLSLERGAIKKYWIEMAMDVAKLQPGVVGMELPLNV